MLNDERGRTEEVAGRFLYEETIRNQRMHAQGKDER